MLIDDFFWHLATLFMLIDDFFGTSLHLSCSLMIFFSDGPLRFLNELGNYMLTCEHVYTEAVCCVRGYTSLTWYKLNGSIWQTIIPDKLVYLQSNDFNQTLTFKSPIIAEHQGNYSCVASDDQNNMINNTFF